jgi:hypothetical protein
MKESTKTIFTNAEAATLYEAQGILKRVIDLGGLGDDAPIAEQAEAALRQIAKCDQYRNESNIPDSEVHAILDWIRDRATEL